MKLLRNSHLSIYIASSFWDRLRGIIGREVLLNNAVLVLTHCNWIHTFFVSRPLYVYFIDASFSRVIETSIVARWKLSPHVRQATHVIESSHPLDDSVLASILAALVKEN